MKRLKAFARQRIPRPLLLWAWNNYCRLKARRARHIFEAAPQRPVWLDRAALKQLQARYPLDVTYHYDAASLVRRGQQRADEIQRLVGDDWPRLERFLDLGAWDGMNGVALQQRGKWTAGVDIRAEGFAGAARANGVALQQMDAEALGFADSSFDLVFSYNSFEHFVQPDVVLAEAVRVTRPGGYIYLNFGPLYMSAKGAHLFKTITVPYCQFLFPKEMLAEFASDNGWTLTDFGWMNEWTAQQYRQLWRRFAGQLKTIAAYEMANAAHVDLIARYPSCFRSKTSYFDNLLVSHMEMLFQKVEE